MFSWSHLLAIVIIVSFTIYYHYYIIYDLFSPLCHSDPIAIIRSYYYNSYYYSYGGTAHFSQWNRLNKNFTDNNKNYIQPIVIIALFKIYHHYFATYCYYGHFKPILSSFFYLLPIVVVVLFTTNCHYYYVSSNPLLYLPVIIVMSFQPFFHCFIIHNLLQ